MKAYQYSSSQAQRVRPLGGLFQLRRLQRQRLAFPLGPTPVPLSAHLCLALKPALRRTLRVAPYASFPSTGRA